MAGGGIPTGPGNKAYPGNLTLYVTFTCVVAAMGDLIFGYDIGISSNISGPPLAQLRHCGVTSMDPFLKKFFPSVFRKQSEDTSTNQYCKFDTPWKLGLEAKSRGRSGPRLDYHGQVKEVKVKGQVKESTSMATSSRTMPDYLQGEPKMKSSYSNSPQSFVQFNKKKKSRNKRIWNWQNEIYPVVNGSKAKSVTKESFKLRQKGSLQSTPSSSFISSNKLGKSINLVKTVIRNKNIVKKKSKQDLPSATSVIENVTFVPDTCQLVCERCHCALKELNPPPCTRISTEVKHGFSQTGCGSNGSVALALVNESQQVLALANRLICNGLVGRQAIHDMMKRNSGFLGLRHFNLLNKLGCGDTGTMYLAELVGTNHWYAIKVMDNEFLERRKKNGKGTYRTRNFKNSGSSFSPDALCSFCIRQLIVSCYGLLPRWGSTCPSTEAT
ncbi:sugar carrier protein C-like protein [Tanacetum coccineum]